jgi:hypothetical protein
MARLATVIFTLMLLGGVAGLFSVFGRELASVPEPQRSSQRQKRFVSAVAGITASAFGLFCLFTGFSDPLETLAGVMLMIALIEVFNRTWKREKWPRPICIARDVKTGESLGEVVEESREWSKGAIETFKIRTLQGSLIERSADSITIESKSEEL